MLPILAVHVSDGALQPLVCVVGFAVAIVLALPAIWRIDDREVPRIALLTAAFFVASSIHVRIGPTSVHLLLNGLVGVVLGRRAPLAIAIGLLLQAALLGHGGWTTLGINTVVLSVPALIARQLFVLLRSRPWWGGLVAGTLSVMLTSLGNAVVLIAGGIEDWSVIAYSVGTAYLVLSLLEGAIVATIAAYLARVKPDLLPGPRTP